MVIYLNVDLILGKSANIWAVSVGEVWLAGLPTVCNEDKSWQISASTYPKVVTELPISTNEGVFAFNAIVPWVVHS